MATLDVVDDTEIGDTVDETVEDETELLVVVWGGSMVTEASPELAALLASPGYAASIVALPLVPATVIEQLPPAPSVHMPGSGIVTFPVEPGAFVKAMSSPATLPMASASRAVHVELPPAVKELGAQLTEVVVAASTVTMAVALLAE